MVTATKEGRDRDQVTIEDRSTGDTVDLSVEYPHKGNVSASVDFDIRVPRAVDYNFGGWCRSAEMYRCSDVMGNLQVECVSGDVDVSGVSGVVSARPSAGRERGSQDGRIGKHEVLVRERGCRCPGSFEPGCRCRDVDISGSLKTDFQLEVHEPRYGAGHSARRARIGETAASALRQFRPRQPDPTTARWVRARGWTNTAPCSGVSCQADVG